MADKLWGGANISVQKERVYFSFFLINLSISAKMSSTELYQRYLKKHNINLNRIKAKY
jgi:hypothetical protein